MEWENGPTTVAVGKAINLKLKKKFTSRTLLGSFILHLHIIQDLKVNSGEYKLMGLAPYGNPIYIDKIKKLIDIKDDGTFRLDQKYFNYSTGLTMTNSNFDNLFGQKPRNPDNEDLTQFQWILQHLYKR